MSAQTATDWAEYERKKRERMTALARSFHYLDNFGRLRPGVEPFDYSKLAGQLRTGWAASTAAQQTILFVLSVWGSKDEHYIGDDDEPHRFELHRAMGAWDDRHRAAFVAWANAPWWC